MPLSSSGLVYPQIDRTGGGGVALIKWHRETVQLLEAIGASDGLAVGDLGIVDATGNIYRAVSVAAGSSVWAPASGVFNLRDFGAVGDNTADDTIPAQAWLDTMNAFLSVFGGGAEGMVDPGDYRITATLNGHSNLLIRGAGKLVSRFRADDAAGFSVIRFLNKLNVVLESFGVEGDGQGLAGGVAIDFDNTGQSIVRDLDVRTVARGIVFGNGSEDCRAEQCWAVACTTPFEASDSSNDCHFLQCRSVNALAQHLLLDGVSQCTGQECSFQVSGTETGVTFAATNQDNIACGVYATRTEGAAGIGYDFQPGGNTIAYATIQDPYWTGGITPVANWTAAGVIDPRVINRSRYWEPIIQEDPFLVTPGDEEAKLKWHNEGVSPSTEPKCLDPREHDGNTGTTGAPVILRRNIGPIQCGANNQSTGGGPVYQAFQNELGSLLPTGARVAMRMPFAGRILKAGVVANQDHGANTDFEVWVNSVEIASDTQPLGAGPANAADFVLSTNPADQHWAAGDYVSFALDTPVSLTTPITVCNLIVEFDMRTSNL